MGFQFRRLFEDSYNDTNLSQICSSKCLSSDDTYSCDGICSYCYPNCSSPSPPHRTNSAKFLISGLVLASVFFLVFCYAIYYKFYSGSRRGTSSQPQDQRNDTAHEEFLDEDHGPILDHPIWYINTIGLQPSVINSISVCKYKRGDGLVEGTDCSVCLNEFKEDETLRLLPKCNHAFHIPCIDTWLRSHTNCPMCRAPIVANSTRATSSEGTSESVNSSGEETRIEASENDQESERELEGGDGELRVGIEEEREADDENARKRSEFLNGEEEEGIQSIRRSISLDSLSAFKISQALVNVCSMECDRNSRSGLVKESESSIENVPKRVSSNQSLLKFMATSSIGRSLQIGPSSLKRSLSCGGKLFLSRYSRNSNSLLPF